MMGTRNSKRIFSNEELNKKTLVYCSGIRGLGILGGLGIRGLGVKGNFHPQGLNKSPKAYTLNNPPRTSIPIYCQYYVTNVSYCGEGNINLGDTLSPKP